MDPDACKAMNEQLSSVFGAKCEYGDNLGSSQRFIVPHESGRKSKIRVKFGAKKGPSVAMTGVILNTWLLFHVSGLCSLITHAHTHGSLLEQMKKCL